MTKETILVVDDSRQIADFIAGRLLSGMGYDASVVYNGRSAIEFVRKNSPALILLDYQLSDMTGLEVVQALAKENFNIPVILVTGYGSEQTAVEAFRLGVQDYLIKPVDPDKLNMAVRRALTETRLRNEKLALMAQLKEQVTWMTVLSSVGKSVTSILELDEVLRKIVEAGVQLTRAEEGFLALLDEQNGQLYVRAVKNIDEDKTKTLRLPVDDSLVGSVIRSKKPLRMVQRTNQPPLKVSTGFLVYSFLHVPLISKGRVQGVLSVYNRSTRQDFKDTDEALLTSLGDYAAIAIENASLYQRAQQEIKERGRVEMALRESEERYALAVRGANDGIWDWNLKTNKIYYSPRWKAMLGFGEEEISDSPDEWFRRIHPADIDRVKLDIAAHYNGITSHFENENRMRHKDGSYRWVASRGLAVKDSDGSVNRMAGSQTDITDRKCAEQKLLHDAFHDMLTGLANRALFIDRLKHAVERAKRREEYKFAVLFLDLDRFKDINDSHGHMMGDQLLIQTAQIIAKEVRTIDTVARLGGDEFVLLLEDIVDVEDATRIADRIQKEISSSFALQGREMFVTTSIGIVLSTLGYNWAEDVLRDADIAMYRAKALGKARYVIFDPGMRNMIMERLVLETDLRHALDRKELKIFYQPIVNLGSNRTTGFEALVRWDHPERGMIPPEEFIRLAEETGLIIHLDRLVLDEACRQMSEWHQQFPTDPLLTISVNISGKQFVQGDLIGFIQETLKTTGLDARCLKLEITESAIMENIEHTNDIFARLKQLGIQIEIDDFGIGYSSLSYLSHFPISAVKIDRSFVNLMSKDGSQLKIVQAIVMLAHGLGIEVIAEGVETENQLLQIRALGCEQAQGYIVSMPADSHSVRELLVAAQSGEKLYPPMFS